MRDQAVRDKERMCMLLYRARAEIVDESDCTVDGIWVDGIWVAFQRGKNEGERKSEMESIG
jgi:hypothetical protein